MLQRLKKHAKSYPSLVALHRLLWSGQVASDWRHTYILKTTKMAQLPFGFKLVSGNYAANRAMLAGEFETEETNVIRQHLSGAEIFVDVGANIGLYACLARSAGKYVIAIEPQTRNLEYLYASLSLNGWADIEVYPLALGDGHGLVSLYGASGPSASLLAGWAKYSKRHRQLVPLTTLDTLIGNRFAGKKLLIKVDVEGAEYAVLRGAQTTLAMSPRPTWMVEICLNEFHPSGLNPNYAATFETFWKHGYEVRTADKRDRVITSADISSWVAAGQSSLGVFNYIFTPKHRGNNQGSDLEFR